MTKRLPQAPERAQWQHVPQFRLHFSNRGGGNRTALFPGVHILLSTWPCRCSFPELYLLFSTVHFEFEPILTDSMFKRVFPHRWQCVRPHPCIYRPSSRLLIPQCRAFSVSQTPRIMELSGFTETQLEVREAISKICSNFSDVNHQPLLTPSHCPFNKK